MKEKLILLVAFALGAGAATVGGVVGSSERAVIHMHGDAQGDDCNDKKREALVALWAVNGGDCDCPEGFSPVASNKVYDDEYFKTVCLQD